MKKTRIHPVCATALACAAAAASAAEPPVVQVVKPPQAQAWIDVATFAGMGLPAMGGPGGGNPMAMLGGLFGGGKGRENSFGNTQLGSSGRWVDVTLYSRSNPRLAEGRQEVPAGFLSPALLLQEPKLKPGTKAPERDDEVVEREYERPKGRLLLYWGCGASVRPGQPKVLDMENLSAADLSGFFVSRRATQRGAHSAAGRPVWPSRDDTRMVPAAASLVGEHGFSGEGVPEGFRFRIPAQQDLMPPLQLRQAAQDGATELSWTALPTARAYFLAAMGGGPAGRGNRDGAAQVVFWTSSELPDTGFGLLDYQTNAAVDRWLKDKVLLPPDSTQCTIPKGVFPEGPGAMLRMIAYGSELNLVHPPRPADPKVPWEQLWAAKIRVKSQTTAMLGMPDMPGAHDAAAPDKSAEEGETAPRPKPEAEQVKKPKPLDLLKGLLGR